MGFNWSDVLDFGVGVVTGDADKVLGVVSKPAPGDTIPTPGPREPNSPACNWKDDGLVCQGHDADGNCIMGKP